MKNKNIVYGILAVLIIILGIYFIYNKESKKNQNSTTENKTEVEKVETKINNKVKKEVNHVETKKEEEKHSVQNHSLTENKENDVKAEKKDKKENAVGNNKFVKITSELLEAELKKSWKDRISIYKNNPNLDYNLELKVPKKWSHLDYSKLGNPPEVELPEKEIQKNEKDWERFIQAIHAFKKPDRDVIDIKHYFSKEREAKVLKFFVNDRQKIKDIINKSRKENIADKDYIDSWEKSLNSKIDDINKIIYIDEKTGRKELVNIQLYEMGITPKDLGLGTIGWILRKIVNVSGGDDSSEENKYIDYIQSI